jgi:hypothetical protein
MFGLTYLSLFTDISICDTRFGELMKTTYNVNKLFSAYLHKALNDSL